MSGHYFFNSPITPEKLLTWRGTILFPGPVNLGSI